MPAPKQNWYDLAKKRTQAEAVGMPYANLSDTDAVAMSAVNELLPSSAERMKGQKRNPLRLAALRSMFPGVSYAPTDATGGMR